MEKSRYYISVNNASPDEGREKQASAMIMASNRLAINAFSHALHAELQIRKATAEAIRQPHPGNVSNSPRLLDELDRASRLELERARKLLSALDNFAGAARNIAATKTSLPKPCQPTAKIARICAAMIDRWLDCQ